MGAAAVVLRALLEAIEAEEAETGEDVSLDAVLDEIETASGGVVQVVEVDPLQAGYTTMGILTAACALHEAHDNADECSGAHEALETMIAQVRDAATSMLVISNLATLAGSAYDQDEIQHMAADLARAEIEASEDED